jgi:hypothetical protein
LPATAEEAIRSQRQLQDESVGLSGARNAAAEANAVLGAAKPPPGVFGALEAVRNAAPPPSVTDALRSMSDTAALVDQAGALDHFRKSVEASNDMLRGIVSQSAASNARIDQTLLRRLSAEPPRLPTIRTAQDRLVDETRTMVEGIKELNSTVASVAKLQEANNKVITAGAEASAAAAQRLDHLTSVLVGLTVLLVILTVILALPVLDLIWHDWLMPAFELLRNRPHT